MLKLTFACVQCEVNLVQKCVLCAIEEIKGEKKVVFRLISSIALFNSWDQRPIESSV